MRTICFLPVLSMLLFAGCVQGDTKESSSNPEKPDKVATQPVEKPKTTTNNVVTPKVAEPFVVKNKDVRHFLGDKIIQVLAHPDYVDSFLVNPEGKTPSKIKVVRLKDEQIEKFQSLVFSEKSYLFGIEKRCGFRPEMALRFVKDKEILHVILSFSCNLWRFVYDGEGVRQEDFDPVRKEIEKIVISLSLY